MKRGWAAMAAGVTMAVMACGQAQAKEAVREIPKGGLTLAEVVAWLQGAGYKAEIKSTKDGEKFIGTAAEGGNFDLYLDDCDKDKRCTSLEFVAGFDLKDGLKDGQSKINEWNSSKRWLRGYVDKESDPWCIMDVSVAPGRSYDALDDDFTTWRTMMNEFKTFIGW